MEEHYVFEMENVSFSYGITSETTADFALHCHNYYEVYYFAEGDVEYLVEGQKYVPAPDSVILIAPHVFHGVKINSDRPYRRFSLHFDPNVLSLERRTLLCSAFPFLSKVPQQKVYFENARRYHISTYFYALMEYRVLDQTLQRELFPVGAEALLSQIVCMSSAETGALSTHADTIFEIIWYLNKNPQKRHFPGPAVRAVSHQQASPEQDLPQGHRDHHF